MKNIKIDAVIFDMDGVIFDTERVYMDIWIKVCPKHGYNMTREVYTSLIGRNKESVILILKKMYGQSFPAIDIFDECELNLKEAIDNGQVPIKSGALELLEYLKNNKYKMALATSSPKTKLDMQLKIHNLKEIFDEIVCGDDVSKSKPDPEIFELAAKRLCVCKEQCIVIEDSPAGIIAAYSANMIGLHVEDLVKVNEDIIKHSKKQFKDLVEVREFLEKVL